MVVPLWAMTTKALTGIEIIVNAKTRPAEVTTDPLPVGISSVIRATTAGCSPCPTASRTGRATYFRVLWRPNSRRLRSSSSLRPFLSRRSGCTGSGLFGDYPRESFPAARGQPDVFCSMPGLDVGQGLFAPTY